MYFSTLMSPSALKSGSGLISVILSGLSCLSLLSLGETSLYSYSFGWLKLDEFATILITLSFMISSLMCMAMATPNKKSLLNFVIWVMNLSLLLVFLAAYALSFYLLFEASLLPIMLMIFGWGYQPERVSAAYALIFYTVTASFPLLVFLLFLNSMFEEQLILWSTQFLETSSTLTWISLFMLIGFLVKLPIFAFHLWLPKAHVEAPVAGSMILAALLLKLGGYGLYRFVVLLPLSSMTLSSQSLALLGGGLVSILCIRQTDMKILIAYSSVAHMSMVIGALLAQTPLGALAALSLMVAHGVSSSAMFAGANFIYEITHTRSLVLTSGLLNFLPTLSCLWFLVSLGNMGAPPTINLMSEIWSINTLASLSFMTWLPIAMLTFFATVYTLILYSSSQQGQPSIAFQSHASLTKSACLVMGLHATWLLEGFLLFIYSNLNEN